jgi:hypothetical protein
MGENASQEHSVDWESAEVEAGKLAVALDSKPEKVWKEAFERTIRLLNRGTWDEVTLKKGRITLETITPGEEERARHFLESVVLEANSAVQPADDEAAEPERDEDGEEQQDEHGDPRDREMTERLRSFGERSG